jgi:hypothetical protein
MLYACAVLKEYPGEGLTNALRSRALTTTSTFSVQSISNILWAWAMLEEHPGKELLGPLCERGRQNIDNFRPKQLNNILWALMTLGEHDERSVWVASTVRTKRLGGYQVKKKEGF